jgi:5-deoxy-glucuronate isomerase
MRSKYYLPAGAAISADYAMDITPESAGWAYSSLRIVSLGPAGSQRVATGDDEVIVLPLSGSVALEAADARLELDGRESVFAGPTDLAYVGIGQVVTLRSAEGGRFALCGARTEQSLPLRYGSAKAVPVELRGAGQCSRQVRNFGTPGALAASKIIACEVITPAGNWSSYPAHKHDEASETESELEEIYYFEIADGDDSAVNAGPGFGFHRVYGTAERPIDVLAEVRTGDVVLVPHGYHGPSMAAPGFHMYYLNVMAGPERAWRVTFDPAQAWVRDTWADQSVDPRLPLHRPASIATPRGA